MTALRPPHTSARVPLVRVEEAIDAHRMAPRLRAAVGAVPGDACHVLDAKYEPGVRCTVLYGVGRRLVRGDLVEDGPDGDGTGARPVVAPGVRLCTFPDDPDLGGLAAVVGPSSLGRALSAALPGDGPVLRCRAHLVRYRPGKRATFMVEVRGRSERRARRLVVKSYHDGRKAAAVAAEAVLLDLTADPSAPLRFAPVLAHLPDLALVVQGHVPGVRLDQVVGGPAPAGAALRRAAVALAALHRQPAVSDRVRPVDAELVRFATRAERIAQVAPRSGDALLGLATRLADTRRNVPSGEVGLVHGDCKPSQFLLRGDRDVVLLDLDSCGRADPAGDVGTFLATLRQQVIRRVVAGGAPVPGGGEVQAGAAEEFLRAYTQAVGATSDGDLRQRIAWYEAVALQRKALRSFARAPRSPLTRSLVDAGHARLDRMGDVR